MVSENCAGQNRSKIMLSMYIRALQKYKLDKIEHFFLESGHTQNENDSVHSLIERKTKHFEIYSPQQWYSAHSQKCNWYTTIQGH